MPWLACASIRWSSEPRAASESRAAVPPPKVEQPSTNTKSDFVYWGLAGCARRTACSAASFNSTCRWSAIYCRRSLAHTRVTTANFCWAWPFSSAPNAGCSWRQVPRTTPNYFTSLALRLWQSGLSTHPPDDSGTLTSLDTYAGRSATRQVVVAMWACRRLKYWFVRGMQERSLKYWWTYTTPL